MPTSLLAFARRPATACPLPPLDDRRRQYGSPAGWPVGLLPFAAIAADLAELGVTYRHGIGYARHGERLDADEVARLAADVLTDAATLLPQSTADAAREVRSLAEDWSRTATLDTLDALDDGLLDGDARDLLRAPVAAPNGLQRLARQALAGADPAEPSWRAHAFALRATAADVRTSSRARSTLVAAIRSHLDAPAETSADGAAATRFLATFDDRDALRRPELSTLYSEAGSPGDLTPPGLRDLAAARWGAAVKSSGTYVYRPARSTPPAPPCEVASLAEHIESEGLASAREYAVGRRAFLGDLPPVELLVELFDLAPSTVRDLFAELDEQRP